MSKITIIDVKEVTEELIGEILSPKKAKCKIMGCRRGVADKEGYCGKHKELRKKQNNRNTRRIE